MKKITINCDCCFNEIQENEVFQIEHYIHVDPSFNRLSGHGRVIDGKMYSVSGRTTKRDFCLPCYNMLFEKLFVAIKEHKKE